MLWDFINLKLEQRVLDMNDGSVYPPAQRQQRSQQRQQLPVVYRQASRSPPLVPASAASQRYVSSSQHDSYESYENDSDSADSIGGDNFDVQMRM